MAKTLEELRKEDPALAEQFMAEARVAVSASGAPVVPATPAAPAVTPPATPSAQGAETVDPAQAERQRLQDIDALAGVFDAETIKAAKYGSTPAPPRRWSMPPRRKRPSRARSSWRL